MKAMCHAIVWLASVFTGLAAGVKTTHVETMLPMVDEHPGAMVGSALALRGDVLLAAADYQIGGIRREPAVYGRVYAYARRDGLWVPSGELPRPASMGLRFAFSLGFDGRRAVVGSLSDTLKNRELGYIHIYRRDESGWVLEQAIEEPSVRTFGWSVAIDGEWLGASALNGDQGKVFVYRMVDHKWTSTQCIASVLQKDGSFGHSVRLLDDTLAVATRAVANGSVEVFRRIEDVWRQEAVVTSPAHDAGDGFGHSIAMDRDLLLVGAPQLPEEKKPGKAFVFRRDNGKWLNDAILEAPDGAPRDWFGVSVAIYGDKALIGAYGADGPNGPFGPGSGACYLFEYSDRQWRFKTKCVALRPSEHTSVGYRVDMHSGWLAFSSVDTPVVVSEPRSTTVQAGRIFSLDASLLSRE